MKKAYFHDMVLIATGMVSSLVITVLYLFYSSNCSVMDNCFSGSGMVYYMLMFLSIPVMVGLGVRKILLESEKVGSLVN